MNPIRMAAVTAVTLALALYSAGTIAEQRSRRATAAARMLLSLGVTFDILATALMVVATGSPALTLHGLLGYSALSLMLIDVVLLWRHASREGNAPLSPALHRYARIAYGYWVVAYFTGAALVMSGHARPS